MRIGTIRLIFIYCNRVTRAKVRKANPTTTFAPSDVGSEVVEDGATVGEEETDNCTKNP